MWAGGFDKSSGPGSRQQTPPAFPSPSPSSSSSWFTTIPSSRNPNTQAQVSTYKDVLQNSTSLVGGRFNGNDFPPVQDLKRTRSPPAAAAAAAAASFKNTSVGSHPIPPRINKSLHTTETQRLTTSHVWTPPYTDLDKPASTELPVPKRTRPTMNSSLTPSVSPPKLSTRPDSHVWTPPYADLDKPATNPIELPVPKRTRLPFSTDHGLRGNSSLHDDDAERELQAKAKRLARFRDELSQPEPSDGNQKPQAQQAEFLGIDKRASDTETGHLRNSNLQTDGEDQDSSAAIIGFCPDMCPEQERAERERKGDLDQYERLGGDRNHTTKSLAVKKYTRTAEREAALIRPMEILQKTMDYLLDLLEQAYDDKLLGLYNFLWDRMRAIRMDLRMQHIFNLGAITMLEQMIRLHIIAMHELCEYTKGEGFSEGFDAHLNIEQMNKTSVELFQLYDDHRKNGTEVPTEREFRGYYALLKLDKHPGYKVEPSELSLDLAKMTPGIRQAGEVLFARNVARACRSGNFIAFFRLARKASYLQACLMHAHFGKLRTQALAALHSGLQNNQGIPVTQVAKWLGMEEENMEDLLEYHGFSIKEFEEPYMVKEGPFLNGDGDYPLKCSKLVHLKRSTTIVDDVLSPCFMESSPPKGLPTDNMQQESPVAQTHTFTNAIVADDGGIKNDIRLQPMFTTPAQVVAADSLSEDHPHLELASPSPRDIFKTNNSFHSPKPVSPKPSYDKPFRNSLEKHGQSTIFAKNVFVETVPVEQDPVINHSFISVEDLEPENVIQQVANEIEIDTSVDEQVAEAKLKLILRLWRRRALIKKDLRNKKQLAANAALNSLSLGPPVCHFKEKLQVAGDFDFDRVMCERYEKQEQLQSRLNVSNVVAAILGARNQYPNCICWKLLFFSLHSGIKASNLDPASWLRHKLMPENISKNDDELVASSPGLSIWKKWDYASDLTCYFSVVRNIQSDDLVEETVLGASAVMLVASEYISWEAQKIRLHNLVSLIPYASCLPLLILSGSSPSTTVENLGLNQVDRSKICSFSVLPIDGDENLRKALEWLASESPVQPVVHCVKTRDLVMNHLQFDAHKRSPEHCISAINDALDESIKEICDAAKSNPASWPCPEISLLDFQPYLPSVGWSSASRIEPLIQALKNCKLPNNISWCSLTGIDIQNQKTQLEYLLVTYLRPLMGLPLAQKEASTLIQNCVGLELHGSTYYLVPKWNIIFRRIFNWQLTSLPNATAYVLERQHMSSQRFEDESCYLKSPSLDDMMQVVTRPGLESEFKDLEAAVCDPPVEMVMDVDASVMYVEEEDDDDDSKVNERSLSRLLEQCNIVQDIIDKKLSVYF
ncbi:putative proteasome component (PCI) domain-containing protein [Helianthus annuus]|nr:putative proteasome component (PCI) domain-containing protein [Helianthus annuus]